MRGVVTAALVVASVALASGCVRDTVDAAAPPPARVGDDGPRAVGSSWRRLTLGFDTPAGPRRTVTDPVPVAEQLILEEVAGGTAHVRVRRGPGGTAAAFGRGRGSGPVALVVRAGGRALTPGGSHLRLGADFALRAGSGEEGANIVQRGLFDTGSQIKLQVDDTTPSCRITGNSGSVLVEGAPVTPGTWYRALCERDRARVTLYVAELGASGPTGWTSWTRTGATGVVSWLPESDPLSIGAKVNSEGGLVSDAPDQFLGLVDNVVLEIEP